MSSNRTRTTLFVFVAAAAALGCAVDTSKSASASDDVTSVENTDVRAQAVANCWLFATAGWAESLHKGVAGEAVDLSEAYWTYWYWYEQLTGGKIADPVEEHIANTGQWVLGAELIRRYGWMYETDFIPEPDAKSKRHAEAAAYIDASLKSGPLAGTNGAADPALARAELDRAWRLGAEVVGDLDRVFSRGNHAWADVVDRSAAGSLPESRVRAPRALSVLGADGRTVVSLEDVVGKIEPDTYLREGYRVGPHAWSVVSYTWRNDKKGAARRNAILRNVQDVLNRRLAVPVSWLVSETASAGVYRGSGLEPWDGVGVHVSLLVDYEVEGVPGFGTLRVSERETRPEALSAALTDPARVTFFRMKNSWGKDPELLPGNGANGGASSGTHLPAAPGYNDIYVDYLDAPIIDAKHFGQSFALPPGLKFPLPDDY